MRRVYTIAGFVLLAVLAFVYSLSPFANPDAWHHLTIGRWIAQHGAIPFTDHWTYTAAGERWIPHEWLYQALLYATYVVGGFVGLSFTTCVLAAATVVFGALTARVLGARMWVVLLYACVVVPFAAQRFLPRPHMATFALAAASIYMWEQWLTRRQSGEARRRWTLWLLVPIYWIWANCHAGISYGAVLYFTYALDALVGKRLSRQDTRFALLASTAAMLGTLAGPNHVLPYLYGYLTLGKLKAAGIYVQEFGGAGTILRSGQAWLVISAAIAWVLSGAARKVPLREVLFVSLTAVLAVMWQRERAFFWLVNLPFFARGASWVMNALVLRWPRIRRVDTIASAAAVVACGALAFVQAAKVDWRIRDSEQLMPQRAVQFAAQHNLPTNAFVTMAHVGYLQWRLPQKKVYVDMRYDLLPEERLREFRSIMTAQPGFADKLRHAGTEWLLLEYPEGGLYSRQSEAPNREFMQAQLFNDERWSLVYWDDDSLIYVRKDLAPADLAPLTRVNPVLRGTDLPEKGAALTAAITELVRVAAAAPSLRALRLLGMAHLKGGNTTASAAAYKAVFDLDEKKAGVAATVPDDYYNLAYVLDEQGDLQAAEQVAADGLRKYRDHVALLDLHGILLARRGDLQEAIQQLEHAEQLDPGNADRAANLGRMRSGSGTGR